MQLFTNTQHVYQDIILTFLQFNDCRLEIITVV